MNSLQAAKKHGKAMLFIVSFAAFILYTSDKRVSQSESAIIVSDSSFRADILSTFAIDLKEIHGIKVRNLDSYHVSYYFEYEADQAEILTAISSLPFNIDDNRISLHCGLMNSDTNPLESVKNLSRTEVEASEFFWKAKPEEYTFYECLKGSLKHTMLISKTSAKILHRIEMI